MARLDEAKIIDRELEAEVFAEMLRCETERRVLVVTGRSGMGKSDVLRKLRFLCEFTHEIPAALLPLEDFASRPDRFVLVERMRTDLVLGGASFPAFDSLNSARAFGDVGHFTERLRAVQGSVDLREAQVGGTARVAGIMFNVEHADSVAAPLWTDEAETQARAHCIQAFLADLRVAAAERPVVLLFDTVEQASEDLRRWLLLDLIKQWVLKGWQQHKLIAVLAGQGLDVLVERRLRPEHRASIEPGATLREWSPQHVGDFLRAHGFGRLSPVEVDSIHRLLGAGHTLTRALLIAEVLMTKEPA